MQSVAVVQDNREPGGNPGRSRRCVCGVFLLPDGSHCENGKTKKCKVCFAMSVYITNHSVVI